MISEQALYKEVGKRLKDFRENRSNLTQDRLAAEIGLKRTSITNIESGQQRLPLHTLFRICEVLRIEVKDLLPDVHQVSEANQLVSFTLGKQTTQIDSKTAMALNQILSSEQPGPKSK